MIRLLLGDIWQKLRWRAVLLALALVANGLAEGLGLVLLFPLLAKLGVGAGSEPTGLAAAVDGALSWFGVSPTLPALLAVIVAAFAFQNAMFLAQSFLAAEYQNRYTAVWRDRLFAAILRSHWSFFGAQKSGVLINTLINETNRLSGAFFLTVQLAAAIVFVLIYLGLAAAAAWQISLVLAVFGLAMFLATRPLIRFGRRVGVGISRSTENMQTQANEILGGAKLIKATATEEFAIKRFAATVEELFRLGRWSSLHPNLLRSIYEMSGIVTLSVAIALGLTLLNINPAGVIIAVYLFVRLYSRLSLIQQNLQALNINAPAILTVTNIHRQAEAAREMIGGNQSLNAFEPKHGGAQIDIRKLVAGHGGAAVLHGLDLKVDRGEIIGLAGNSGAGKSTLMDCVLGLINPTGGKILIDGQPLDTISCTDWRKSVGYVAQDTILFNASVRENIGWGNEAAHPEEIVEAARRAHAHEFIQSMTDGYDTIIGDRGDRMSGGQRQRLGLARALLGRKSLLILDEATNALDAQSEASVTKAVSALRGQLTTIIVAHRLSAIRHADRIYVLDEGHVVDSGTWESLAGPQGYFHESLRLQQAGTR